MRIGKVASRFRRSSDEGDSFNREPRYHLRSPTVRFGTNEINRTLLFVVTLERGNGSQGRAVLIDRGLLRRVPRDGQSCDCRSRARRQPSIEQQFGRRTLRNAEQLVKIVEF